MKVSTLSSPLGTLSVPRYVSPAEIEAPPISNFLSVSLFFFLLSCAWTALKVIESHMTKKKIFFIIETFLNDRIGFSGFRIALILKTEILTQMIEDIFRLKY